ncbi:hypothetical protein Tco_0384832 [Tanacetum coccineum]
MSQVAIELRDVYLSNVCLTQRFTQDDGAQSPRVPVPFSKDPYEAIRRAYLVETDTESEPFEDPVKTETPESPHTVASPTPYCSTTPTEESVDSDTSGARSMPSDSTTSLLPDHPLSHPAKAETRGVTSWISSQHNGVKNRESIHA